MLHLKNKNGIRKISAGFLILTMAIFLVSNMLLAKETIKGKLKTCILGKFEKGKINLNIEATEEELSQGIFRSIHLEAKELSTFAKAKEFFAKDIGLSKSTMNASLPGLTVDEAVVAVTQGKFDLKVLVEKGEFKTLSLERVDFYVAVSEKNLTEFIRKQNPHLKNLKIKLLKDRAKVQFNYIIFPIVMTGRFVLEDSKVYLRKFKLYLVGIQMIILQQMMAAQVNPLADLKEFPFSIELEKIEVTPGHLEIYTKGMKKVE
jgi:hypothetical protein